MQHQGYFDNSSSNSSGGSSGGRSSNSSSRSNSSQVNDCNFRYPYREMGLGRQQHRVMKITKMQRYEQ